MRKQQFLTLYYNKSPADGPLTCYLSLANKADPFGGCRWGSAHHLRLALIFGLSPPIPEQFAADRIQERLHHVVRMYSQMDTYLSSP